MNKLFGKLACWVLRKHVERRLTKAEKTALLRRPCYPPLCLTQNEQSDIVNRTRVCIRCGKERVTRANKSHRVGSKAP